MTALHLQSTINLVKSLDMNQLSHTEVKLANKPDWPELERLKLEAEAIGFYMSAHPLDSYCGGMERLGVKSASEVLTNIKLGDSIRVKLAGCANFFQK